MTMAVSKAVEEGAKAVICASTGNTSASAAAYAARAGLTAAVVIPEGKIAAGKLAQALAHGAQVLAARRRLRRRAARGARPGRAPPDGAGQLAQRVPHRRAAAPAAFEVCDELGDAPDVLCIPVGNAGNISAYWLGLHRPIARPSARAACRGSTASRPPAPRRWWTGPSSPGPRPWPPPSASATRPAGAGHGGHARVGRRGRGGHRLADPRGLPPAGGRGGHLLRAGVGGLGGRAAAARRGRRPGARRAAWSASSPATA